MIRKKLALICIIWLLVHSQNVLARIGVSVAGGRGSQSITAYRLNLQKDWGKSCPTHNQQWVYGYTELAATTLNTKKFFDYPVNRYMQIYTLAAALRIKPESLKPVFFDIGLGVAYTSKQKIGSRDLGTNLSFEERLGLGLLLGRQQQFEFSYRLLHYSNGYLAKVNNGMNIHLLILGYWFN